MVYLIDPKVLSEMSAVERNNVLASKEFQDWVRRLSIDDYFRFWEQIFPEEHRNY